MTRRKSRQQVNCKAWQLTRRAAELTTSGVDSTGEVPIHSPTASHRPIVVPTPMPFLTLRIDHLVAQGAFRVPVAKQKNRPAVVAIGGPLSRSCRVHIPVETPVGFAIGQHDHLR